MSFRFGLLIALSSVFLGSTAAFADLVGVTSYDMNNGNGAAQFTFGPNYLDFTYKDNSTGLVDPNANKNGSNQTIPNNAAPKDALLTGGKGLLTDGKIPTDTYSVVTGATSGQYVGWKYQDPTILFHLAGQQSVSSISLYVAATSSYNLYGLVAAPKDVVLKLSDGTPVTYTTSTSSYLGSPFTTVITLALSTPVSSNLGFSLTLDRGPLQADGTYYYDNHVKGYDPANPYDSSHCVSFCDPDAGPFSSGFRTEAALGQTGTLAPNSGLEPWIMLSEVQFFSSAVPEPSTWIMMVLGFAGLGFMTYRKRQTAIATA
jgi:PEP-CTERM motif